MASSGLRGDWQQFKQHEQRDNIMATCESFRDTATQWRRFRRGLNELNL